VNAKQEARLDRAITLNMMGDWGTANLHRICGWISAELWRRSRTGSRFATWAGRGGTDAIEAVLDGMVDTALFVPAGFAATVFRRLGICNRPDVGRLRALGTLPQDDRLVLAVDAALGIETFADLRRKRPRFRLVTGLDDGVNMTGFAAHRVLETARVGRSTIEAWGGAVLTGEAPWDTIPLATRGEADAVLFEAVMTPYWRELLAKRKMNFLPFEDEVLSALESRYAWRRATVPKERFTGLAAAFEALDFSDFLLICRDDLADDIGYVIAALLCETPQILEAQYRHLRPQDSPVTYPLEPRKIARAPIPHHEGARRYYAEHGLLD
jgi:uncharacterized protein